MIGDLHCHSTLSDGSSSLEDLVLYAKNAGLDYIALTDHDTLAGNAQAVALGKRCGVGVIPGVEFSAVDSQRGGRKVHILCYFPRNTQPLEKICRRTLSSRTQAGEEMIRRVMEQYPVTAENIARYTSASQSIYKSHIMLALMDLGYTDRVYSDLFHKLFGSDGSCFVPTEYAEVREVVSAIRDAGGLSVMAHPFQYGGSYQLLEELAQTKMIDGVELHHPRAKQKDMELSKEIAERYNLICTGGTDFHGACTSSPNPIGTYITSQENRARIIAHSQA
ncbi:MAG: PHP domain-containing protein [Oscillospiraceae bacterium]|nr:PHP domain-containing protein [Oscillospiraceae bacterium]